MCVIGLDDDAIQCLLSAGIGSVLNRLAGNIELDAVCIDDCGALFKNDRYGTADLCGGLTACERNLDVSQCLAVLGNDCYRLSGIGFVAAGYTELYGYFRFGENDINGRSDRRCAAGCTGSGNGIGFRSAGILSDNRDVI